MSLALCFHLCGFGAGHLGGFHHVAHEIHIIVDLVPVEVRLGYFLGLAELALESQNERQILPHTPRVMTLGDGAFEKIFSIANPAIERIGQGQIIEHRCGIGFLAQRGQIIFTVPSAESTRQSV